MPKSVAKATPLHLVEKCASICQIVTMKLNIFDRASKIIDFIGPNWQIEQQNNNNNQIEWYFQLHV